jgi:hypothetical protein
MLVRPGWSPGRGSWAPARVAGRARLPGGRPRAGPWRWSAWAGARSRSPGAREPGRGRGRSRSWQSLVAYFRERPRGYARGAANCGWSRRRTRSSSTRRAGRGGEHGLLASAAGRRSETWSAALGLRLRSCVRLRGARRGGGRAAPAATRCSPAAALRTSVGRARIPRLFVSGAPRRSRGAPPARLAWRQSLILQGAPGAVLTADLDNDAPRAGVISPTPPGRTSFEKRPRWTTSRACVDATVVPALFDRREPESEGVDSRFASRPLVLPLDSTCCRSRRAARAGRWWR